MGDEIRYIQILEDVLQEQVEVLGAVLDITEEQKAIAEAPEFDQAKLEDTLNRKEILIDRLNELDTGFMSIYEHARTEVMKQYKDQDGRIVWMQELIRRCTDLSVEIKVLEARNRQTLVRCFADRRREYDSKKNAASVASRYHQTMLNKQVVDPYFFNKKN